MTQQLATQTAGDYCLLEAYVILSGPYTSASVKQNLTSERANLTLQHSPLINTSVCDNKISATRTGVKINNDWANERLLRCRRLCSDWSEAVDHFLLRYY